ncbi:uncharacterized protein CDAR_519711 [Caerostris darwini]|uniref:Uncharacterized protein n=1 Tax=Caerostris darwini TaxID=1538125 RepID=A0AAV4UUR0_9ARAC|nr:uncharacterized protein CDAR_519711 [Caerostris darwini]
MDGEDSKDPKGKENKRPEMNIKDEHFAPSLNQNESTEDKIKGTNYSLPHLPGTPDSSTKCGQSDGRKRSPVRFPALLIPSPDKASRPRSTVAGILFLPSIL